MYTAGLFKKQVKASRPNYEEGRIYHIPVSHIFPNPAQPRKNFADAAIERLADSIRQYGILQPLTVRRKSDENPISCISGTVDVTSECADYEIIAGERRLRAARSIGITEVPCIVISVDSRRSAELAIIENIQREDLNIFEQAGAIASLIDIYGLTQEQIAAKLSASQSYVANKLRILRLTPPEREVILEHGLTERHARALLRISDLRRRADALRVIASEQMNVARADAYIDRLLNEQDKSSSAKAVRKLILKDIRIFYNTIERAVDTVSRAGVDITSDRTDTDDEIQLVIRIKKQYAAEQPETKGLVS